MKHELRVHHTYQNCICTFQTASSNQLALSSKTRKRPRNQHRTTYKRRRFGGELRYNRPMYLPRRVNICTSCFFCTSTRRISCLFMIQKIAMRKDDRPSVVSQSYSSTRLTPLLWWLSRVLNEKSLAILTAERG